MVKSKPFSINVPQSVLDDLQKRLTRTRWPDEVEGAGWSYGTSRHYMQNLADYWLNQYDWRQHEAYLNTLPQYTAEVDGVTLHFIHQPSANPDAIPVLLMHGWPDSFYRYHNVIPLLTNKFHLVIPSIPGMGFSERTALTTDNAANLMATLMTKELGYETFISAGGDSGALISMSLANNHPELLRGLYLTDVGYPDQTTDFASLSKPEQEFADFIQDWFMKEGAFNMIQSTKTQTLAYSLTDSPVGLAAWIMSMMSSLSTGEELDKRFGQDELLTNIMIYWVTQTIGSSMQIYRENMIQSVSEPKPFKKSDVPAGVAHCPWDAPLPREWAERRVNLIHFTDLEKGGHFTAWEAPDIWANDFQTFVQMLNKR
ncbi:epoxide hydrolase family protein [Spirosoma validum]|uniref:Epoxide hydrolase n=1 Tax=Spirosoma validum TaxID=2771355 RepID=A0A927B7K2_9BACT|nr:epoxide hydrolase family protein [Spirosoma validum]MBD2756662.1 epoxide hydrolase [Spirosoma validum]